MEIIGTIAFASSGALAAFKQDMDIFGVNVLAVITSAGEILSMFTGTLVVLVIRLMAMIFKWNLPKLRTTSLKR